MCIELDFSAFYATDQAFGSIYKALNGDFPLDKVQCDRVKRLLPRFTRKGDTLCYGDKVCVPRKLIRDLLHVAHDAKTAGHFAFSKTLARLENFHWKNKTRDVQRYCQGCLVCQQRKDSRSKKLTEPTPLEVLSRRWGSLATDFVVSLPKTKNGYDAITTWVDRLSGRVHFIPSKTTDTAVDAARVFFDHIFKPHRLPDNIVSDRDPKFTSKFWTSLLDLCGVRLKLSTSHHSQTDGASEVMNRMVENYLRCNCSYEQDDWDALLPAAEFAYNSSVSEELGASPFDIDLGWNPRSPIDMVRRTDTPVESVNNFKRRLGSALQDAMYAHAFAKARQSAYAAKRYQPPSYKVNAQVWVNKTLFKDTASKAQASDKLSAKRYGPFRVHALIGRNALRLELPSNLRIHPVVHVEHTTPFKSQPPDISPPVPTRPDPVPSESGELLFQVSKILKHRKRGRGYQWLTLLEGAPQHEAEWQSTRDFVDADGTVTPAFLEYIKKHDLLTHLHWRGRQWGGGGNSATRKHVYASMSLG